jgi:Delta3-Delta2-enoyl-CoA isomerase
MASTSSISLPLTLPIPNLTNSGYIRLSRHPHPSNSIYILSINSPPDNRLSARCLQTLLKALDIIEQIATGDAVLLTTSEIPKFFSNGFDLAVKEPHDTTAVIEFMRVSLKLLQFPIPTIAVLNGHCVSFFSLQARGSVTANLPNALKFAAGVFFAMSHDYRIMGCKRFVTFGMLIK